MSVETRTFTRNGVDYLLTKTTGTRCCDHIERLNYTGLESGYAKECIVDTLELQKVNSDGTLETVQKKLVEKPTSEVKNDLDSKTDFVEKRITRENIKKGEKSVVENVRTHNWYKDNVQNVKLEIPEKVDIEYCKEGSSCRGFNKFKSIDKMFLDLTETCKPGNLRPDEEVLSNIAKRLLRRGLR